MTYALISSRVGYHGRLPLVPPPGCERRARRHGYVLRRERIDALGQTWDGWVVEGITPPAAFIGDAGLLAWLDALDRGRRVEAAAPEQMEMEWAA